MTTEQLRRTHQATLFRPFSIRMVDDRQYSIPHRDFLSFSPVGRTAVIFHDDGSASIVNFLWMTKLELSPVMTTGN